MRSWFLGRLVVIVLCAAASAGVTVAQGIDRIGTDPYGVVYRPDSVAYRVQNGDRFTLIYQKGTADMARRVDRALRRSWGGTDALVGPVADGVDMPVVVNNYSDRSNGIVDPVPFRQEIEAPSIKSDPLVARAPSWPSVVAPHEAVHAAHAEVAPGPGIGALLRAFAPDLSRATNLNAPAGLIEGVAVYRESHLVPGMGRLNAPLFTMKMKAALLSDDPWSLTQMLEAPTYTRPFNRFYVGGGHVFEYLAERSDSASTDFFGTMVGSHNRVPILGHGLWLKRGTGQWPTALRNEIQTALRDTFRLELERDAPFTSPTVIASEPGRMHRRPYWLGPDTLVTYVAGYNTRPGFYRIDAETGSRRLLRVQSITEDYAYSLGPDTAALYASRYTPSLTVPTQRTAEIERINLSTGDAIRLTDQGRAFAPARSSDGTLYTSVNDGPFSRLAEVTTSGAARRLTPPAPLRIREVAPSPTDNRLAVLVNEDGRQRLYRAKSPLASPPSLTPWVGLAKGEIYDVSWGPKGRYLLFAGEQGTTANVYAYDTEQQRALQLTNVRFGALEPTLSPNRAAIAFIRYQHERHDLVRLPFQPDSARVLPDSLLWRGREPLRFDTSAVQTTGFTAESEPYRAWRYLKPRMVHPTVRGRKTTVDPTVSAFAETVGIGVTLSGSDPLQRWAYKMTGFWQDGRPWAEAKLQTGRFLLRPSVSGYVRPLAGRVGEVGAGIGAHGANVGVQLPLVFRANEYQTLLRFGLDGELRRLWTYGGYRLPSSSTLILPSTRATITSRVAFGYRLQQNERDVVPNTGMVLTAQGAIDAWTSDGPGSVGVGMGIDIYLPFLRRLHTGFRVGGRLLSQEQNALLDPGSLLPRGTPTNILPPGTFAGLETEVTQPIWYIDDGLTTIPVYAEALSAYGFASTLGRLQGGRWAERATSVGGGISLQSRFFYGLQLDLRLGVAFRLGIRDAVLIGR